MSLPALATVADLAAWLGESIDDDNARAQVFLRAASGLVRDAAGQTWATETETEGEYELTTVPEKAWTITLQAAARGWLNPGGKTDQREGPFGGGWDPRSAGIMLTEGEEESLGALKPGAVAPGLGLVRMRAPLGTNASRYVYGPDLDQIAESDPGV